LALLAWRRWRDARGAATAGFDTPESAESVVLDVEGMSCQHCVGSVKRTLEAMESVDVAAPDLSSGRVVVTGQGFAVPTLVQAIEQAGFTVQGVEETADRVDASRGLD
jgi:copper chaperone CopZ